MSFPQTPLVVLVEVFLGADLTASPTTWVATDATALTFDRQEDSISITRGRPDQSRTADPSTLSMTGDNRGGHWSTKNPMSPWYGQLHKGTPVRVSAGGHVRYTGFLSELPPRWDLSEALRWAPLKALGLLYQLGLEGAPERSALRRTISTTAPVQYWPLEDGKDATSAASGILGGASMLAADSPLFGAENMCAGTALAVDFGVGGSLSVSLAQVATSDVTVSMEARWDDTMTGTVLAMHGDVETTVYVSAGLLKADFVAVGSTVTLTGPMVNDGVARHIVVTLHDNGVVVQARLRVDGVQVASANVFAAQVRSPSGLNLNPSGAVNATAGPTVAHLLLYHSIVTTDLSSAAAGYIGEQAHTRFLRLCTEESVLGTCAATESIAMGAQLPAAFLPLLRDLEASDQGYLYEGLDFGLVYQSHTQRENMTPALALDYTTAGHVSPPLEPTDDDQDARNDIEVKREGGSSARTESASTDEFGRASIGRRKDEHTYSLETDDLTTHVAGWRLHMLTWPGYRWPVLTVNLAAAPSLITSLTAAGLAFRTTIANPPDDAGSSTIDLIADGSTETIKQYDWLWQGNCVVGGPWRVGILANDVGDTNALLGRDEWDTCVLAEALDTTETGVDVTTTPLITTAADDFPFTVFVGGEQMTATACSGVSNPQTLTVTRSVNGIVKTHLIGAAVTLADVLILTL